MEDSLRGSLECPKEMLPFIFTRLNSVLYKEMRKNAEHKKHSGISPFNNVKNIKESLVKSQMKVFGKFMKRFSIIYNEMMKNFTSAMLDVYEKFGEEMKKLNVSQEMLKLHQNATMLSYQKTIKIYLEQFANFSKYTQSVEKFLSQYANGTQFKLYMEKHMKQYMNESLEVTEKYMRLYMNSSSGFGDHKT